MHLTNEIKHVYEFIYPHTTNSIFIIILILASLVLQGTSLPLLLMLVVWKVILINYLI